MLQVPTPHPQRRLGLCLPLLKMRADDARDGRGSLWWRVMTVVCSLLVCFFGSRAAALVGGVMGERGDQDGPAVCS